MIFAEGLHVLESSGSKSSFNHIGPNFRAAHCLSNLLPLDDPCTIHFVLRHSSLNMSGTIQVEPALEFFEFGFAYFHYNCRLLINRKIITSVMNGRRKLHVIWFFRALLENEDKKLLFLNMCTWWKTWTESGYAAGHAEF